MGGICGKPWRITRASLDRCGVVAGSRICLDLSLFPPPSLFLFRGGLKATPAQLGGCCWMSEGGVGRGRVRVCLCRSCLCLLNWFPSLSFEFLDSLLLCKPLLLYLLFSLFKAICLHLQGLLKTFKPNFHWTPELLRQLGNNDGFLFHARAVEGRWEDTLIRRGCVGELLRSCVDKRHWSYLFLCHAKFSSSPLYCKCIRLPWDE